MITPARIVRRLRALLGGTATDRDMDDEMRAHLEMEAAEGVRRGLPSDEAWRRARHAFGGVERFREEGRDARGLGAWRDLSSDLRYGLRILKGSPVFTVVAVTTLALGIGANTAIFSVVNAVVLRPLPFPDTKSLVSVWDGGHSLAEFLGVSTRNRTLESVAAYFPGHAVSLSGAGEPVRLTSALVTSDFFRVLQVQPQAGRFFAEGEDAFNAPATVVLSHALWRDRFSSDPSIVGRAIEVDGVSRTVIGVAATGFTYPSAATRLWLPLPINPSQPGPHWGSYGHQIIGRLKPGATSEQARDDVVRIAGVLQKENPVWRPELPGYLEGIAVTDLRERTVKDSERLLFVLLGAVGLVLLMACANVANLLAVRGASRERELAVRSALGAGTGRLARQLLVENLMLAIIGGSVGLAVALGGVRLLTSLLPATTPRLADAGLDPVAFAFTALLTLATGLVFGIGPARRLSRSSAASGLAGGRSGPGARHRRVAGALVSAQIAVGVVLAVGAALLVRSLVQILDIDPGFATTEVVSARLNPPRATYATPERRRALAASLTERLRGAPGVRSAAITTQLPFDQTNHVIVMYIDGWVDDPNKVETLFEVRKVSLDFFSTMGIPIRRGRGFSASDGASSVAVAIVSEAAARRYWSGKDAVGGKLRFPWPGWLQVVGVAADVRNNDLKEEALPALYVPFDQVPEVPFSVVAQTAAGADPGLAQTAIRAAAAEVAPDVPVSDELTMAALVERSVSTPRAAAMMFLSFGVLALALGAVGTYGLVAYGVESRRREFALRIAIGAGEGTVMRMVLREGVRLAIIGIAMGVLGALALTRLLRGLLFGIGTTDPVAFVVAPVLLGLTALLACVVPAWRAMRVDPNSVLRRE